jgi:hypothetical protein
MSDKGFDYWEFFAAEARRSNAPLYVRLTKGVSGDPQIKALANTVRKGQPPANVLFGAVHFLLLRGAEHPLRRFYPNLNGGVRVEDEDPFPDFRDFVETNRAALAPLIARGVTNTSEVGRSALLHAGFRALARQAGEPLNLVELGPGACLNFFWDRYSVRYHQGAEIFTVGAEDAPLVLDAEARGERLPPLGLTPKVASRVGLELNPVDITDPDVRDWLKALVWPDHVARFERLEKALAVSAGTKPNILVGDALTLLPDALRGIPEDQTACVYHSFVVYQFSEEMREALDNMLTMVSLRRPIWRLSCEGTLSGENPLLLYSYRDGIKEKRLLALCDPHGGWLEWRDPATSFQ